MARTVYGAAAMLTAMAGYDPCDPVTVEMLVPDYAAGLRDGVAGLRIGLDPGWALSGVHQEVKAVFQEALAVLEDLGAEIVEVSVPCVVEGMEAALTILMAEATGIHEEFLRTRPADYQPDVRARLEKGLAMGGVDYGRARRTGELLRRDLAILFQTVDLLATPMCGIPAPRLGQREVTIDGETVPVMLLLTRYTRLFNLTGLPAISVPCGFSSEGLPIGLQLVGRAWDEATVLRAAHAYETATTELVQLPYQISNIREKNRIENHVLTNFSICAKICSNFFSGLNVDSIRRQGRAYPHCSLSRFAGDPVQLKECSLYLFGTKIEPLLALPWCFLLATAGSA
jgi:aspartyl-tRNA(Asn)/glutamyl-tRNA(Gln) amidotransferase subunit A